MAQMAPENGKGIGKMGQKGPQEIAAMIEERKLQMEEKALELRYKKKQNKLEARQASGRTQHDMSSMSAIMLMFLSWLLFGVVPVIGSLRQTYVIMGYATMRRWGFLAVQGLEQQLYYTMANTAWDAKGGLQVGSTCVTPICAWYFLKYEIYVTFWYLGLACTFFWLLAFWIHTMCLYWLVKFQPQSLRGCFWWSPVFMGSYLTILMVWLMYTEMLFPRLNAVSWYPTPPIGGAGFYAAALAFLFASMYYFLVVRLSFKWPEVEDDSESEDEDEDEDDDKAAKRQRQAAQAAAAGVPGIGNGLPSPASPVSALPVPEAEPARTSTAMPPLQ